LKSFTGKRVILYFWAGWDAQSRKVNRRLAALYPEIHKKNTELLGISFDENAVVWKGAIRLDNLPGIQLSDLKGLYSPMASAYNIADRLPYFYLIGVDQKIEYKHQVLDSLLMQLN
jgi:peroxiredoxin